jgi:hypothetical protein
MCIKESMKPKCIQKGVIDRLETVEQSANNMRLIFREKRVKNEGRLSTGF